MQPLSRFGRRLPSTAMSARSTALTDSDADAEPRERAIEARLELKSRLSAQQIARADDEARRMVGAKKGRPPNKGVGPAKRPAWKRLPKQAMPSPLK